MRVLRDKKVFDIISNVDIIDELPVANYELKFGAFGRISLEQVDDIMLPEKIYSNDKDFIKHVMYTWETSENVTGLGLVGGKGLGKSFTGNIIAKNAGVPVIRLVGVAPNSNLFGFLNKIEQDFVLFIDEFEKNFSMKRDNDSGLLSQEDFLTFLDGGTGRKHKILLIITANDEYSINNFLKNRPSRLRYYKEYKRLEDNIIQEIVGDLLVNEEFKIDLLKHLPYEDLNIDVLIKIIQEINLHNKPYSTFKSFFNYTRETNQMFEAFVHLEEGKEPIKLDRLMQGGYLYDNVNLGKTPTGINVFLDTEYEINISEEREETYDAYTFSSGSQGTLSRSERIPVKVSFQPTVSKFTYLF